MADDWNRLIDQAVTLRRDLHRQPELTWAEEATALRIRTELDKGGISWRPCARHGTVAMLAREAPGRPIALRADMDALPVAEETNLPWASEVKGQMHACGHDGHTAAAMASAFWLKHQEAHLPGPVSLLFQPAEEGGHGAKAMIEDGALEGVHAIYGWHNWPVIPYGQAICPDGPVMSANGTFRITVTGQGGHASQPELCRDPVLAAAAITVALQQVPSRRIAPQTAVVLSVTSIEAPSTDTIIPSQAVLGGSIRIADDRLRATMSDLITHIAEDTARAHGVTARVEMFTRYDATVNDPAEAKRYRAVLAEEFGPQWRSEETPVPAMASEDFSDYLKVIPGAFALVGADDGNHHDSPCHSPHFDFNDALIPRMVRIYARLAGAPLPR